jgi:hypothetical protein
LWQAPASFSLAGNSVTATSNPSSPTATIANTYTLNITDNHNGCKTTTIIPVFQNLFPPVAKIVAGSSSLTCSNPTIMLSNFSTSGIPPGTFSNSAFVMASLWSGPAPQTTLANSSAYAAFTGGTYTMIAKDLNNGCTSSTTTVVTDLTDYPTVSSPGGPFCLIGPVVIISPAITGAATGYTYSWSSPAGAQVSGATTASLATNMVGIYTISVSNPAGCTKTVAITVSSCTDVGVPETSASAVKLYPNPTEDILTVESNGQAFHVEVYNFSGQIILRKDMENESQISFSGMPNGIYLVKISKEKEMPVTVKVLKR